MIFIVLYGVLIVVLGVFVLVRPDRCVDLGIRYCEKPYMHPIEILICIGFGTAFALFGDASRYPRLFVGFGYLLMAVGLGLLLAPPSLHRRFGVWSLERMRPFMRVSGVFSLLLGLFVLYGVI